MMLNQKTRAEFSVFRLGEEEGQQRACIKVSQRLMQLSLKSVEILLQAAVRGGLIGSLIYCALQYFSNADLFHLSKSSYWFGFANKHGNNLILFIYFCEPVKH